MTDTTLPNYTRVYWTDDDGRGHHGRVLSDRSDEGERVHIESNEIFDYDDDGLDDDGRPIMRPLYERYRVPRERVSLMKVTCSKSGKQTYGSREAAIREAERMSHITGRPWRSYKCEHCGFHHLTSHPWRRRRP